MEAEANRVQAITNALADHWPIQPFRCECGQTFPISHTYVLQREHMAEMIDAALEAK